MDTETYNEHIRRVAKIFGLDKAPSVDKRSLKKYLAYLKKNIKRPCELTGVEDFMWEEFYVLGPGDPDEYEEMKITRPSYEDTFQLLGFCDDFDERNGIFVKVRRISGPNKKHFSIGLDWLKCVDQDSKNFELTDDYSAWFVNSR